MSENPFQSPQKHDGGQPRPYQGQPGHGRGYVQQVPVIASLFIAQGVLLLFFAILMTVYAFMATQTDLFTPPNAQQAPEVQELVEWILSLGFGVMSGVVGILSLMYFISAYLGFKYKGRIFGIWTMAVGGTLSVFTCYCAPTAIGLAVYGMIIYFNPAVKQAFEMRKSGLKGKQIMDQFPN